MSFPVLYSVNETVLTGVDPMAVFDLMYSLTSAVLVVSLLVKDVGVLIAKVIIAFRA